MNTAIKDAVRRLDGIIDKDDSELTRRNRALWRCIVNEAARADLPSIDRSLIETRLVYTRHGGMSHDEARLREERRRIYRVLSHSVQKAKRLFKTLRTSAYYCTAAQCLPDRVAASQLDVILLLDS